MIVQCWPLKETFLKCLLAIMMNVKLKSGDFFRFDNDQSSSACVKRGELGKRNVLAR